MPEDEQPKSVNKGTIIVAGIILFAVIIVGIAYIADKPKLTINEDMLGTDIQEGKVLYIGAGESPIKVDYTVKSSFSKPIGNVRYLIDVDTPSMIELQGASENFTHTQVLRFQFTPESETKIFHGWLYIRASPNLKLQKGETKFVTMKIYADWLDYRPKDLKEVTEYWTSEPIETVTVKIYG